MSIFQCPICGNSIIVRAKTNGILSAGISKEGKVVELHSNYEKETTVYCIDKKSHKIPDDLQKKVLDLFHKHYQSN